MVGRRSLADATSRRRDAEPVIREALVDLVHFGPPYICFGNRTARFFPRHVCSFNKRFSLPRVPYEVLVTQYRPDATCFEVPAFPDDCRVVDSVENILNGKGVTAPCMIGAPFDGPTARRTSAEYGIQSVTRIRIRLDGRVQLGTKPTI